MLLQLIDKIITGTKPRKMPLISKDHRHLQLCLECLLLQPFSNLNRIEKAISEQGFDVKRAAKEDIKRFLCVYFGRTIPEKEIPDVDGGYEIARWVIN